MSLAIPSSPPIAPRIAEQREAPGPDRDNDGDEMPVARAAPPAGMGKIVDLTA